MGLPGDIINNKYGRWTVLKYYGDRKWLCRCECGKQRPVHGPDLKGGKSKSCGCKRIEIITKHNLHDHKIYAVWKAMRRRCTNKNHKQYKNYGGRGIKVCKRWEKFENFYKDLGLPEDRLTLERINNNGDYKPSNCRWATRQSQARNRRNNILITYKNKTRCVSEWAQLLGVSPNTINRRLSYGWTLKDALTKKPKKVGGRYVSVT